MEDCQVTMEVFTRDGCHLAHNITYSCGFCMSWTKCIKGSRIAVARQLYFVVWDLQTGHRLSTQHPPAGLKGPASPAVEHGSKLVISPTGAKLAFCAASTSTVHLYDAASLALLGCVDPFVWMQPEVHRPLIGRLVWSVFGWLVSSWQHGGHDRAHYLHFLRPQEGCNKYLKQVLGCIAQPVAGGAFSPDGVFLCSFQQSSWVMHIHDTRSGHLVAKHAVELDHKDFRSFTSREVSELGWSRCGRRIYVRIRLYSQNKVRERVVFVLV